jgi:hypothetical protein
VAESGEDASAGLPREYSPQSVPEPHIEILPSSRSQVISTRPTQNRLYGAGYYKNAFSPVVDRPAQSIQ